MTSFFTAGHDLAQSIRNKELSAGELVDLFSARIAAVNPQINAVIDLDVERAQKKAGQIDAMIARDGPDTLGPLAGVPMTIKDAFEVEGLTCESGVPDYAGHRATRDAVVVQRLQAAGAIIMGKTNTPYLCADIQSFNRLHGTTNNPWNLAHTPGGSSGGSAAALATGMTPLEFGSDIGGSIRTPAHFCGLFGHKPSFGLVPYRGHVPPPHGALSAPEMSVVGPLARNTTDLSLLLQVTMGPTAPMTSAYQLALQGPRAQTPSDLRIGLWQNDPFCRVSSEIVVSIEKAAEQLAAQGARIIDIKPPFAMADHHEVYSFMLNAGMAAFAKSTARGGPSYIDWLKMAERRAGYAEDWARLFEEVDVVFCPITPRTAIPHTQDPDFQGRKMVVDGQERAYSDQLIWAGVPTLCGLPATAVPLGRASDGLPFGMQIIAPAYEDWTAIKVAQMLEELGFGFVAPPDFAQ